MTDENYYQTLIYLYFILKPSVFSNEIEGLKPMDGPSGRVFYLTFKE